MHPGGLARVGMPPAQPQLGGHAAGSVAGAVARGAASATGAATQLRRHPSAGEARWAGWAACLSWRLLAVDEGGLQNASPDSCLDPATMRRRRGAAGGCAACWPPHARLCSSRRSAAAAAAATPSSPAPRWQACWRAQQRRPGMRQRSCSRRCCRLPPPCWRASTQRLARSAGHLDSMPGSHPSRRQQSRRQAPCWLAQTASRLAVCPPRRLATQRAGRSRMPAPRPRTSSCGRSRRRRRGGESCGSSCRTR